MKLGHSDCVVFLGLRVTGSFEGTAPWIPLCIPQGGKLLQRRVLGQYRMQIVFSHGQLLGIRSVHSACSRYAAYKLGSVRIRMPICFSVRSE